jgi:hypothetical protein
MSQPERMNAEDTSRLARTVHCPICAAVPKWPCRSNVAADGPTLPKGQEHGYRLAVAQEAAVADMLESCRKAALDELQTLLSRLQYEDLTAAEAVALVTLLRPTHERVAISVAQSGPLRLIGDAK